MIWRELKGFPYEVSDTGEIRGKRKIISQRLDRDGYPRVTLWRDGRPFTYHTHTLVTKVFLGDMPEGYEVNHKDYNRKNNCLENLEYMTHKENCQYSGCNHRGRRKFYLQKSVRSKSGEKYITMFKGKYRVRIVITGLPICDVKQIETLEKALEIREKFLKKWGLLNDFNNSNG